MNLTVRQFIAQGGFSDLAVLAGENGLDEREVRTVCVIDINTDVEAWIFGGEFLLSSGYIFKDCPDRLAGLIEALSRRGAAALGVKLGRYIDRFPREALRAADKLAFPLIHVPFHYAHTDIINPALMTIADNKSAMMNQAEKIRTRFFDALMNSDGPHAVLSLLREYVRDDVMFVNATTGERIILADSGEFAHAAGDVPLSFLMEHFPYETISPPGDGAADTAFHRQKGYLFLEDAPRGELALAAVSSAREFLRLALKWESERWHIERGRGSQFVQDILYRRFRHSSEIHSRARSMGWNFDSRQAVLVIGVDQERSVYREPAIGAFEIFRSTIGSMWPQHIPHTFLENDMAMILPISGDWNSAKRTVIDAYLTARRDARARTGLHLTLGAGAQVDRVEECERSFREARLVISMSHDSSGETPYFWDEMGAYRILYQVYETKEAADFISLHLGPLLDERAGEPDSLIGTLFCIIRNNWQLKPAAAEMNFHYNTMKYRHHKISELLRRDLDDYGARLCLTLAMELYKLAGTGKIKKGDDDDDERI